LVGRSPRRRSASPRASPAPARMVRERRSRRVLRPTRFTSSRCSSRCTRTSAFPPRSCPSKTLSLTTYLRRLPPRWPN
ncbi:Histone H2B.1, partial [Dichanthelium oligosanthes]